MMWTNKIWQQKKGARGGASIEPGDTGIFATCARHREANCVSELKSLLEEVCPRNALRWFMHV